MGCYVNPSTETKESWLEAHGLSIGDIALAPAWSAIPTPVHANDTASMLPVILVDNGGFTAAAVCYSEREYREFLANDGRPKRVYIADVQSLKTVSDVEQWLLRP